MRRLDEAMDLLYAHGIGAQKTDYGFRIRLEGAPEALWANCGMDNDSSISMSVVVDDYPPTIWFFRVDFMEMAELLVAAFAEAGGEGATRAALTSALRKRDADYDETALTQMTESFLGELEDK